MTLIKPEHFYDDAPPARIIGTECEYDWQNTSLANPAIPTLACKAGYAVVGPWLSNGTNLNRLDSNHIELRSVEALGPKQAAAADLAGPFILQKILEDVEGAGQLYRLTGSFLPNYDGDEIRTEETNGYHESYLIPRELSDDTLLQVLIETFLATNIWGMSGALRQGYTFSQKVWGIGGQPVRHNFENRMMHKHKPMCVIPAAGSDIDIFGMDGWARVERRFADAVMSPINRFVGFAAMSLILRMAEHPQYVNRDNIMRLELEDPSEAAKMFAADLTMQQKAASVGGRSVKAIDAQEILATEANALVKKIQFPEDEVLGAKLWLAIVERMKKSWPAEGQWEGLEDILDVAARHVMLLKYHGPTVSVADPVAAYRNLVWDRVLPGGKGTSLEWWKAHPSTILTAADIEYFIDNPSPDTRSYRRADLIEKNHEKITTITWSAVKFSDGTVVHLKDAYQAIE